MYARKNATNKSNPVKPNKTIPSEELLKDMSDGVQSKLRGLMSQQLSSLWDEALTQFRHSNYRCYYVLALYHSGFSYEEILELSGKPAYQLPNGTFFRPDELGWLDNTPLELNIRTVGALRNLASDCRSQLREHLRLPN